MWSLSDRYTIREEKDGAGLMADLSTGTVYVLNPVALTIMTMCNVGRACTLNDIVMEICNKCNRADPDQVHNDVQDFLALAEKNGFLTTDPAEKTSCRM
jgi:hypothetical protein